ncbi:MAG: GtrA family protein, partial [Candidatus Berkelbacteria bacterium]|nr:GtrA family protein [Candidatus Berkelbacteria bacterium]
LPFRVQTFFKYAIIAAIGLAITEAIIHFLVAEKGLYYNLAKVVAIVIVFFWNFFGNRYWTFKPSE